MNFCGDKFSLRWQYVAKSCLTLCDPMDCSMPGFPVLYCLLELAQTHVHWIGDPIQLSHPLSPLSPLALNLSQHQGFFPMSWLFAYGGQSIGASALASVLPMSIQGWFPLGLVVWSPCCSGDSQESFPTPQFKSINSLMLSFQWTIVHFSHPYMTTGKSINLTIWTFVGKVMCLLLNILSKFVIAFQMMVYCD